MGLVRCFAAAITDGVPFAAIVADDTDPTQHKIIGNGGVHRQTAHRLKRTGNGPTLQTLTDSLQGSHVWVSQWEPIPTAELDAAAAAALHIIRAGEPLPEAAVVKPAR